MPMNGPRPQLVYCIDPSGTLVALDERWENSLKTDSDNGTVVAAHAGTVLWNHFADMTTVHLYQAMVANVRRTGREICVPFRCDAHGRRRNMEMHIARLPAGLVEFRSVELGEEPGPAMPLLRGRDRYSSEVVRMCSWCKKVAAPDWVHVDEAVRRLRLIRD